MAERIRLPFGGGLDRETGIMATRPGAFEDLRNFVLHQGKAMIRPGFAVTATLLDGNGTEVTHLVAGHALRSERVGITVSYQEATETVWIHRLNADGTDAELIGEWTHDRGGWGATPPKISMTESYGRVFMAHDERFVNARAPTLYYDPIFGAQPLNTLTADFLGAGSHSIRFRRVRRHLAYLAGTAYGNEDTDAPEFVRFSVAGDPTTFEKLHYFTAGNRRDAVLDVIPAGGNLAVLKESESYVIRGENRNNFGIFLLDPNHGILAGGLCDTYAGGAFVFSAEGPRFFDGRGPSEEISIPLDLGGAEPSSLVAAGESGFVYYIPGLRVVAFVFGQRVYALTVRVEGDWKWSYWELGFEALCGFTLFTGGQQQTAPTGSPDWTSEVPAGTFVDITVTHVGQQGDETLEVWLKLTTGSWYLARSILVSTSATQLVRVPSASGLALTPAGDYVGAMRYRRGILYNAAYTSADPATWPAPSRGDFTTTIDPPTAVSAVWSRTDAMTEQITLTVTPAAGLEAQDIEIYRDEVLIDTVSGPHVGDVVYPDTGITGETEHSYTFVTVGGTDSPPSDPITCWAGPAGIPEILWVHPWQVGGYSVGVTLPDDTLSTELHDDYDDAGGTGAFGLRETAAPEETTIEGALSNLPSCPTTLEITVKVRLKSTVAATDDYGEFSTEETVDCCEVAP